MIESDSTPVPGDFVNAVREILAHFYDHAYLSRHPLLKRLQRVSDGELIPSVQRLRRRMLEAVELLRPPLDLSRSDPAWRPYLVLHQRYILGKDMGEIERELALSRRQIQREQRRGLEAIASTLWQESLEVEAAGWRSRGEALQEEISRVATERRLIPALDQLQRALVAVRAMADLHSVRFAPVPSRPWVFVVADPAVLRQLLVASLSFAI